MTSTPEQLDILIPVDPTLPTGFSDTPNEERTDEEIEMWWDKPFAQLQADGTLHVRCLDGGAWDRPTFYGVASNIQEATVLANRKLGAWLAMRSRPTVMLDEGSVKVVRMPQKPHDAVEVLATFDDPSAAQRYITELAAK